MTLCHDIADFKCQDCHQRFRHDHAGITSKVFLTIIKTLPQNPNIISYIIYYLFTVCFNIHAPISNV